MKFKLVSNKNGQVVDTFDSFEAAHNHNTKVCYGCFALFMVADSGFGKKLYDNAVLEQVLEMEVA
jgi:hypothetical protein